LKRKTGKIMNKPEHVSPANSDEAVKAGVERAEQTNELTQDDLDGAAGGGGTSKWIIPIVTLPEI
jgi:hypothetical protein